ncbi:MAG TPA: rhodanese-like domain-containing protein [Pyrinomonadaceae bacterium]|nr:rhodanese-like domain-containing protein [Pyrinomonadaceae bacterium]
MQFILTIMLTLTFGLSMLQCQSSTTTDKPEAVKTNTQTANTAPVAKINSAATEHGDEHGDEAPRISLADAKKDFDAGKVVFVDTRAEPSYRTEHIKGAINVPAEAIQTRYTEVPKDKKVIAYCS